MVVEPEQVMMTGSWCVTWDPEEPDSLSHHVHVTKAKNAQLISSDIRSIYVRYRVYKASKIDKTDMLRAANVKTDEDEK